MDEKKKKVRVELRRNRTKPPRGNDLTRNYTEESAETSNHESGERVRAKGDISRHRTVMLSGDSGTAMPAVDLVNWKPGRVIRVHGLFSIVELETGQLYRCAVRRLLKSLVTDERSIVTTGDRVWIRPAEEAAPTDLPEGMIERVEPRRGVLTRSSRRREHVLVANVDQLVIVMSLVQPDLKPHLIDRYIAAAMKGELKPILCLNKADLTDVVDLQPLIGLYSQMGIPTILTSARTGRGVPELREQLAGRATVFSGQSGVGKSSLLNAIQPELSLRVKSVSESNDKGRHTTTTAELIRLDFGGWVVDTPGVRQLQLWATRPEEVEGYFPDLAPYVPLCNFPDCTHIHEHGCAVRSAVARQHLSERRYQSYLNLFHGVEDDVM
ncbi:MAG: ribosome small subunit-dependent GTPase A [Fimbriiglobus sp.]